MSRFTRPVVGVVAAALLVAGVTACGSSSSSSSSSNAASTPTTNGSSAATTTAASGGSGSVVDAKLTEYAIAPTPDSVPAGRVAFHVTNDGQIKHQFTIIRTTKSASTVLSKTNPDDDIPGARGEIASIQPGASKTLLIKNLKAGHYAIVCALPGHYQSGMHVDFTVK